MSDFLPSPTFSGAKLPLRLMHVWGIGVRLQVERRIRDLALFDLAIDSRLRGCDVVALRVGDVVSAGVPRRRAIVLQQKTGRPVQFEIADQARQAEEEPVATVGRAALQPAGSCGSHQA